MTINKFIKRLEKLTEEEFVIWTNKDKEFESLKNDEIVICGQDETETFIVKIEKVYET